SWNFAVTAADMADGMLHVSPATVIDAAEIAVIVPRASLFSGFGCEAGAHLPGPTSTAEPPAVPPPSLPLVKLPGAKVADTFARSCAEGACARPAARPAIVPWL